MVCKPGRTSWSKAHLVFLEDGKKLLRMLKQEHVVAGGPSHWLLLIATLPSMYIYSDDTFWPRFECSLSMSISLFLPTMLPLNLCAATEPLMKLTELKSHGTKLKYKMSCKVPRILSAYIQKFTY